MFATKSHAVAEAMDKINDKYGEFVMTPAPDCLWRREGTGGTVSTIISGELTASAWYSAGALDTLKQFRIAE